MSDSNDELDGLKYWCDLMNSRNGYASVFASRTADDKSIIERCTTREWADSVRAKYGITIEDIRSNPDQKSAPDCFAQYNSQTIKIELTELVDEVLLTMFQTQKAENRSLSANHGEGFERSLWDQARFSKELNAAIDKKDAKYSANGVVIDVLIVHTGEPWLLPDQVEIWLSQTIFSPRPSCLSAYLLMSYFPGYSDDWPVFRLY